MLFDEYLFADYSGAWDTSSQRRAIRLAHASRNDAPTLIQHRLTRDELVSEFVCRLKQACQTGTRVCFGQDHQYSIPYVLAQELALGDKTWREALRALCSGSYSKNAPALAHPRTFAASFNSWLTRNGHREYFYSATKSGPYGLPGRDPRKGDDSAYRLTELCKSESGIGAAKPFNRVGDNGTVGGQSLVGMIALSDLLRRCEKEGVPVAVWPFDGLTITGPAYADAHVMIEPYPSAVRLPDTVQTDDSDALASAAHLRDIDALDGLDKLLDLADIDSADMARVKFEGWIVSHKPHLRRGR